MDGPDLVPGVRCCIVGNPGSGRSSILRMIEQKNKTAVFIRCGFMELIDLVLDAPPPILLVSKPERELSAADLDNLARILVGLPSAIVFTSCNIGFINTVATHVSDTRLCYIPGNWTNYLNFCKCTKIMSRCKTNSLFPFTRLPTGALAGIHARMKIRSHILEVSSENGGIFAFSGPLAAENLEEFIVQATRGTNTVGVYRGPMPGTLSRARGDAFSEPYLRALGVPLNATTISMTESERARIELAAALGKQLVVLIDPTKYLGISHIYGLVEHLRTRLVFFTSNDAEFLKMMKPMVIEMT